MNGGTIPTTITQTVRFYNTEGIIEKDKNNYFVPFITKDGNKTVRDIFLEKFNAKINSPVAYKDVVISSWSPEDKNLVVKGNVDDFRVITEEGEALNYFIITRTVNNVVHYYAFFINDVQQIGGASVNISYEPDHFTNVFFLHNKDIPAEDIAYDPFNNKLKNCYIERQHYDRVKQVITTGNTLTLTYQQVNEDLEEVSSHTYEAHIDLNLPDNASGVYVQSNTLDNQDLWQFTFEYDIVDNQLHIHGTADDEFTFTEGQIVIGYSLITYREDNLNIFSQIEEGFKYKRQYRDYKRFMNYGNPYTDAELAEIEETDNWNNLSDSTKIKTIKESIGFLHLVLNTSKVLVRRGSGSATAYKANWNKLPNTEVNENLVTLTLPIVIEQDILKKYMNPVGGTFPKDLIKGFYYYDVFEQTRTLIKKGTGTAIEGYPRAGLINSLVSEYSAFTQYVVSSYITKESGLMNYIEVEPDGINILCVTEIQSGVDSTFDYPELVFLLNGSSVAQTITDVIERRVYYDISKVNGEWITTLTGNPNLLIPMFIEENKSVNFELDLSEKEMTSEEVKSNYYDPVLTFNPYSFWSISYLGRIEVPLSKLNYYEKPIIEMQLTVHVSDIFKYSILPTYEINGLKQKMYSEGIEQSFANQITLITSRLADYVIANQAQMKNQYAVNDVEHGYGLVEAGVGTVGAIAKGAVSGGMIGHPVTGAILGGISGISNLINEGLDWSKDQKVIAMNQKAKLADMGNLPSNLKQTGTDVTIDLAINEMGLYLNHYRIDEVSYNSIAKYLERYGYVVNIFDTIHFMTRKGWDYVRVVDFDFNTKITIPQEESIRQIMRNGVTMIHDESVFTSGHNYERFLDEEVN